jgi:hypothetical protein
MPIISNKLNCIFTHVPKTGGASIKTAIIKADKDFIDYGGYHDPITNELLEKYPNHHKFTVVRNSWKAMSSRYRFTYTWQNRHKIPPRGHPTFREWLLNIKDSHKKYGAPAGVANQHWYYLDSDGNIIVDQIIDFDRMKEGIEELNSKISCPIELTARSHFYGTYNWRKIYEDDPETIEIVRSMCEKDINYFNWEYDKL